MTCETRVTQIIVLPENEPIFSAQATKCTVEDQAAGEYVVIEQNDRKVEIMPEDWPKIRWAVNKLIRSCRE